MAYKYSRGAFVASGSVTLEEGLIVTGSSTLGALTTTTISGTTAQYTILSASNLGGAAFSNVTNFKIPSWDGGTGRFEDSYITKTTTGKTTVSGALGLDVTGAFAVVGAASVSNGLTVSAGNVTVSAGNLSASNGIQGGGTSTLNNLTVNGDLTVAGTTTTVNSTTLQITDANIVIASGSTNSNLANGSGLTLGNTGYQLQFVSSSTGTKSDYWQFSGSVDGLTDLKAGNITATSVNATLQESTTTVLSAGPTAISKNITFVSFGGTATVTLPSASLNSGITYKVKNLTANTVIVNSSAGSIDGIANTTGISLTTQYAAASFTSDGINWYIF